MQTQMTKKLLKRAKLKNESSQQESWKSKKNFKKLSLNKQFHLTSPKRKDYWRANKKEVNKKIKLKMINILKKMKINISQKRRMS